MILDWTNTGQPYQGILPGLTYSILGLSVGGGTTTDFAVLVDAGSLVLISDNDGVKFGDAGAEAVQVQDGDSLAFADPATITVTVKDRDQGTLTEPVTVKGVKPLMVTVTAADTNAGGLVETARVGVSDQDFATIEEGATVGASGSMVVRFADDEFHLASETAAITATVVDRDKVTLLEPAAITVTTSQADAANMGNTEQVNLGADAATSDFGTFANAGETLTVKPTAGDAGKLSEGGTLSVSPSDIDKGSLVDAGTVSATGAARDAGTASDTAQVNVSATDFATIEENVAIGTGALIVKSADDEFHLAIETNVVNATVVDRDQGTQADQVTLAVTVHDNQPASLGETSLIGLAGTAGQDAASFIEGAQASQIVVKVSQDQFTLVVETAEVAATVTDNDAGTETELQVRTGLAPAHPARIINLLWSADNVIACLWGWNVGQRTDFPLTRGEDIILNFSPAPGDGQDLTGWNLLFTLKNLPVPGEEWPVLPVLLTKTTSGGGILTLDPVNGLYQVSLSDVDTNPLTPGLYGFDVWRTDAGLLVQVAYGDVTVAQRVKT